MSDDATLDEFAESGQQEKGTGTAEEEGAFGWGSFGKPPEGWSVSRVEDLLEIRKNSADPDELNEDELVRLYSMPAYDDGAVPELIKPKNIGSKKFVVPNMSLLFSKLNISKKRFWLVGHSHEEPALCSTEYWPVLPNQRVNLEFYLQYFNSDSFINRPRLSTSSTTNSHQRIKSNLFNKVKLPVPPLAEQRKIATVLHTVDQAIEKTEEIIETHESVLSGLIQDIATTGVGNEDLEAQKVPMLPERWKIPTHWRLEFLEDLSTLITDGAHQTPTYVESGIPFLKVENIKNEEIDWQSVARIPEDEHKELIKRGKPTEGDVLLSKNGTIGISKVVDYDREFSHFVSLALIRPKQDILLSDYLATVLESRICMDQAKARSKTGTVTNLHLEEIEKLSIPVPPISEQREILEKISAVRECLNSEESYISRLRRIKQGLMQDLLSGEVRTTDVDIDITEEVAKYG